MRYITSEMLNKVNNRIQSVGTNADHKMKVIASRGLVKELFRVFTVEETERGFNTYSDVALKRTDYSRPSYAYLTQLKNNIIQVKSKLLPYDVDTEWDLLFEISDTSLILDSSIEFDGYWERSIESKRHDFISEEYPYIFWTNGNRELYVQKWNDISSRELLAEDVSNMSVVRGWVPAQAGHYVDQGLIVAYIKADKKAYYSNLCLTLDGQNKTWEQEREIIGAPINCKRIAVSRTNDFRVAFMIETEGDEIFLSVTDRNWSGMSFEPENILVNINMISMELTEIKYQDLDSLIENIGVAVSDVEIKGLYAGSDYWIESIENIAVGTDYGLKLRVTLNENLSNETSSDFILTDIRGVIYRCNSITKVANKTYEMDMIDFNNARGECTLSCSADSTLNEVGTAISPFDMSFTPINLVPIPIPAPTVEVIWNE